MKARHWLLLSATVCAVLMAVFFPQTLFARWDRTELNIVHSEAIDETQLVTNYSLSGADRLQLFCRSGIQARNGIINYRGASGGVTLERRTLDLSSEDKEEEIGVQDGEINRHNKTAAYGKGGEMDIIMTDSDDSSPAPLRERVDNYLHNAMDILEYWGLLPLYTDFSLRYAKLGPETLKVEYCSVTDDNVPFFSMALLCITCEMKDGEAWGIGQDTAFSMVIDEETGMLYAVSITGAPDFVLPYDPMNYMVLADMIGVSCTEFSMEDVTGTVAGAETATVARYNFGGYSFREEESVIEGRASCSFNSESNLAEN